MHFGEFPFNSITNQVETLIQKMETQTFKEPYRQPLKSDALNFLIKNCLQATEENRIDAASIIKYLDEVDPLTEGHVTNPNKSQKTENINSINKIIENGQKAPGESYSLDPKKPTANDNNSPPH